MALWERLIYGDMDTGVRHWHEADNMENRRAESRWYLEETGRLSAELGRSEWRSARRFACYRPVAQQDSNTGPEKNPPLVCGMSKKKNGVP